MPEVSFDSILTMVAAWIPILIGIWLLVGWMITDDIEALAGVAGILILLTIGYLCINPPIPSLPRYLFPALYATYLVAPVMLIAANRMSLRSIDVEAVERAYEVLDTRRENPGAQVRLAKALARLGHVGHALAIAESALSGQDANLFREEFRDLHSWRLAREHGHVSMTPDLACYNCRAPNPAGRVYCKVCGAPHLKALVGSIGVKTRLAGKLFGSWLLVLALIAAIPISANSLPARYVLPVVVAEVVLAVVACWWLWRRSLRA